MPRLNNDELAKRTARRAELTTDYSGEITADDIKIADAGVVAAWTRQGKLAHLGVPAQKGLFGAERARNPLWNRQASYPGGPVPQPPEGDAA